MYKTRILVEGTVVAALALVLSLYRPLSAAASRFHWNDPTDIVCSAPWVEARADGSFHLGNLAFSSESVVYLSVVQVLIEYPIAFTFAGFAGLYAKKVQKALSEQDMRSVRRNIVFGTFIGTGARFFWHFIAGVVFWGSYALWGMNPWIFSLVMNGVSGLATAVVTAIVAVVVAEKAPQLYLPKDRHLIQKQSH